MINRNYLYVLGAAFGIARTLLFAWVAWPRWGLMIVFMTLNVFANALCEEYFKQKLAEKQP